MNRMKAASSNASTLTPTTSEKDDREREIKFIRAVNNWMKDVQFLATRKRNHRQQNTATSMATAKTSVIDVEKEPPPVPYSMFLYLWELNQEHKRIGVRRAALFLSGLLLQRSKDSRFYLDQEENLADWVSSIAVDGDVHGNANASNQRTILQLSLLQKEAIALVSNLLDKGYGSIYAKLGVAAKSLKHRCCPTVAVGAASASGIGMANRRTLRDVALRYGRKEIRKVEKLLVVAEELLLILVPRFVPRITDQKETAATIRHVGEKNSSANPNTNVAKTDGSDNGDSGSGSDSDIDWEDGDDDDHHNCDHGNQNNYDKTDATKSSRGDDSDDNSNHEKELHHLSAVERTMIAMEKTSGATIFSGGNLEIDFDRRTGDGDYGGNGNDDGNNNTNNIHGAGIGMLDADNNLPFVSNDTLTARKKLQEISQKISDKHLVRLSAWLDGLRNSDGLVVRAVNEHDEPSSATSLVSLSSEKNVLRLNLIGKLSVLKQEISRVLSSTSRLLLPNVQQQVGRQSREEENAARSAPTIDQNSNGCDDVSLPLRGVMGLGLVAGAGTWTSFGKSSQKRKTKSVQQRQRQRRRIEINYNTNRNKK
mmetsp:Transcript_13887/g.29242  ORF Transcript_13887/g.29242 Transcript_13887/m.29242 type:complete len:594 (-) Transcript_13887:20-1801(-)